jgi:Transposase IS66 family
MGPSSVTEHWLTLLLRLVGGVCLLALVPLWMPRYGIEAGHAWLGWGEFPVAPIAEYLACSVSALCAFYGGLLVALSFDVRRYAPLICYQPVAIMALSASGDRMIHDGWSPYDQFKDARHQQCVQHLLRRCAEMEAAATRGAVCFPRWVAELLRAGLDLRDRHEEGEISRHGLAVASGRLEKQLSDLVFPPKTNAANERLAQHLWNHRDDLFTFLRQAGLDATNWRAELAIRFGVILRKVWGGSRTWSGARAQSVLMSVWRTCWQQGRSALDFLSQLLRGPPAALALPP